MPEGLFALKNKKTAFAARLKMVLGKGLEPRTPVLAKSLQNVDLVDS